MAWEVHDVEMCFYERMVGHPITGEHVPPPLSFPGYAHPDACPDCAANPELGKKVHAAEQAMAAAMEEIKPFFSEDTPREIMFKIAASFHFALNQHLQTLLKEN